MRWSSTARVVAPLLLLALCSLSAAAAANQYVEDFTSKTFCDTLNTTALWDVASGELRLPPFDVSMVGGCLTYDSARDVVVAGDYAYVADNASGLSVVDISDPTNPSLAGNYDTPGYAQGVTVCGDIAYVADGTFGLRTVDVSDPTSPLELGYVYTGGYACDVAVAGGYAYVADQDDGLVVVDITDSANPAVAGGYDPGSVVYGVAVAGNYAYLASAQNGLVVVDISDPTTPTLAGSCDTPGSAYDVALSGNWAYVADNTSGLQVIDITDPTSPSLTGGYDPSGSARGVAVTGDYVYVSCYASGVYVLDVSDPGTPIVVDSYDTPGYAVAVAPSGEHAYVADHDSGLAGLRVSFAAPADFVGSNPSFAGYDVVVEGDQAYVATVLSGLFVVDISDPTSPSWEDLVSSAGNPGDLCVDGNYAFVAGSTDGFFVVDVTDPSDCYVAGSYATPRPASCVAVGGDYAYVEYQSEGLVTFDISDPTSPDSVAICVGPASGVHAVLAGDCVYLANYGVGLTIVDVSDPLSPVLAGSCDTPGYVRGVAVAGDYAFVADDLVGLDVISVADPTNPVSVAACDVGGRAWSVAVEGDWAFVADADSCLHVIDISDPTDPTLRWTYRTGGSARAVAVAGDLAFVGETGYGIEVVRVFQRELDISRDAARSLDVEGNGSTVLEARLSAAQTDSVAWELSADSGSHWEPAVPGGDWVVFSYPGSELLWRSTHTYALPDVNPTCTDLTIEMLCDDPFVASIADIPNDQGRQVRVAWDRSAYDALSSGIPITEYSVFRRVDDVAALSQGSGRAYEALALSTDSRSAHDVLSGDSRQDLRYPPGSWDHVATVPAYTEDEYSIVVPTLADSTVSGGMQYSVFFVRAATATPGVYFDSPPDSGYSVDNLAPSVPAGFAVDYAANENELSWLECEDEDFQYFRIYRGIDPEFEPGPENLVHMTVDAGWVDLVSEGWQYNYKVSAVDFAGNESDAASPETVTGVDVPSVPNRYALYQNVPNPLNPTTTIAYDVPANGGEVSLYVFDVRGRLVRRLVDGRVEGGRRKAVWDGRDEGGDRVASGVYYYRLQAPGYERTLKMTVLK